MPPVLADLRARARAHPAWNRWGMRGLLALVVAATIAQVPWVLGGHDDHAERLRAQRARTRAEIGRLEAANVRLLGEIEALKSDVTAIEAHARDELGMVYPGELVLQVERVAPAPRAAGATR